MPRESPAYPKRYWWLVLLVLPLALAVIAILPSWREKAAGSGPTITQGGAGNVLQTGSGAISQSGGVNILNSDLSTRMAVTNISVIAAQYERARGQPLQDDDLRQKLERAASAAAAGRHADSIQLWSEVAGALPLPAVYNNLGVEYARSGDLAAARKSFDQAAEKDPDYPAANLNRGLVAAAQGRLAEAAPDLARASSIADSQPVLQAVQAELRKDVHALEIEPNDDLFTANRIPLDTGISAAIASGEDTDCFQFTSPPTFRDLVRIRIENRSTTLQPGIHLYDAQKTAVDQQENGTSGANLEHTMSVQPDTTYYLQVYGHWRTTGAYTLTVSPLRRYDASEPNDDILHAKPIATGQGIQADIMDAQDVDYFQFKTGAAATVRISIDNRSTTLQPGIVLYDAQKSAIDQRETTTSGANLEYSASVQPNQTYYLQVYGHWHTGGAYTLTVSP